MSSTEKYAPPAACIRRALGIDVAAGLALWMPIEAGVTNSVERRPS
ncbi:MAG: hypothetical protein M3Y22_15100 [Pseudomonadota bacterium]|nr:hypothetical protein [Pseudomonadota bacterium]